MINAESSTSVEGIIADIYQALLNPSHWRTFLRKLLRHLVCDAVAISLRQSDGGTIGYAAWESLHAADNGDFVDDTEKHRNSTPLYTLNKALRSSGDTLALDKITSNDPMYRCALYRNLVEHLDCDYKLAMYISEPSGWECRIGMQKICLGTADKRYLLNLRSDIECALKIYSRIKNKSAEYLIRPNEISNSLSYCG